MCSSDLLNSWNIPKIVVGGAVGVGFSFVAFREFGSPSIDGGFDYVILFV